ncbi:MULTISPECIES: hypothetical protein [Actinomyces]|uniref:Uncharacterized protein n=1 Tax=Actinomyces respiraculi TaxID=2744574 RepID=A0A7T0LK03_9ACTO|nr:MULTISPECIES: hypothetical protein [Actinomyces]QPL05179.1 hypothetical protein ID810_10705 [Actinomyces respiraculi]
MPHPTTEPFRLLTRRSLLDLPVTQRHRLDAERIHRLAGTPRCGDLSARQVAEPQFLVDLAASTCSPDELLRPDDLGWRLAHSLEHALEQGVRLWLAEAPPQAPHRLTDLLGDDVVHVVSLTAPEPVAHDGAARNPDVVIAISPLQLVLALAERNEASRAYLRTALEGLDTLRCPRRATVALRGAGVALNEHPRLLRWATNPVVIAYVVIFIYSSLRALPVAFVPGFHGHWWVLWLIDIVTAVPYTWGLVEMAAGPRIRRRLAGLVTTVVTFVAPYVYFWMQGRDYPRVVIIVVVAMIAGSAALETLRMLRDRMIVRGLRGRAG